MGDSKLNMPEYKKGDVQSAGRNNQLVSAVLNLLVSGDGIKIKQVHDKIVIENEYGGKGKDADLLWAEVYEVHDDYLECVLVNPVDYSGTTEIKVAKPEWLQKTRYNGKKFKFMDGLEVSYSHTSAYERTATVTAGGSGTYDEVITPGYAKHDDNTGEGYTGHGSIIAVKRRNTGVVDADGAAISYIETIVSNGRDWAVA